MKILNYISKPLFSLASAICLALSVFHHTDELWRTLVLDSIVFALWSIKAAIDEGNESK